MSYVIKDKLGEVVFKGVHSSNNFYTFGLDANTCMSIKINDIYLYHQRLGHMNTKGYEKCLFQASVEGYPYLKKSIQHILGCMLNGQAN